MLNIPLTNTNFHATFWVDTHAEALEAATFVFDKYYGKGKWTAEYADVSINATDAYGDYEVKISAWGA